MSENVALERLTARQKLALAVLLAGGTQEEAAEAARVTTKTIQRWRKQDAFQAALDDQAREALRDARLRLAGAVTTAVATMQTIMLDDTQPASVRLRAASHVAGAALKLWPGQDELPAKIRIVRLTWGDEGRTP